MVLYLYNNNDSIIWDPFADLRTNTTPTSLTHLVSGDLAVNDSFTAFNLRDTAEEKSPTRRKESRLTAFTAV